MFHTVTFNGIPFGRVFLHGAPRATGRLAPMTGYDGFGIRAAARRLGQALRLVGSSRASRAVSVRALAGSLAGHVRMQDRLGLEDSRGMSVAIVHIVIVEFPGDSAPMVVVELREQAAPIGATRRALTSGPGDRSRPAA